MRALSLPRYLCCWLYKLVIQEVLWTEWVWQTLAIAIVFSSLLDIYSHYHRRKKEGTWFCFYWKRPCEDIILFIWVRKCASLMFQRDLGWLPHGPLFKSRLWLMLKLHAQMFQMNLYKEFYGKKDLFAKSKQDYFITLHLHTNFI